MLPVPGALRRGRREPVGWQPLAYLCRRFFRFLLWLREDLDIFRSLEETSSESAERQAAAVGWGSLPAGHPQTGPDTAAPFPPAAPAEAFVAIALRTGPGAGRSFQPGAAPVRVPALLPVPAPVLVPVRAARGDRPLPRKTSGRDRALALPSLPRNRLLGLLSYRC